MAVVPERVALKAATRCVSSSGCWISHYSVASHGYAQIGWVENQVRTMTTAHRAAWVFWNKRQIGPGMTIDHICKNRRCVNPLHLREISNLENARRTSGRDWSLGVCINGHSPEHWKPKNEKRQKGYCSQCRLDKRRNKVSEQEDLKTAVEKHDDLKKTVDNTDAQTR